MDRRAIIIGIVLVLWMVIFPCVAVEYNINNFLPNFPNHCYIIAGSPWGDGNNFMRFANSTLANEIIRYNITSINPSECNTHSGTFIGKWNNVQVIHGNFIMNTNGIYLSNITHDSNVSGAGAQIIEFYYSTGMWYGVHGGNGGGDIYMYMETSAQAPYGWHNATFENGVPPTYCFSDGNWELCVNASTVANNTPVLMSLSTTEECPADYYAIEYDIIDGGSAITQARWFYWWDSGILGFGAGWKETYPYANDTTAHTSSESAAFDDRVVYFTSPGTGYIKIKIWHRDGMPQNGLFGPTVSKHLGNEITVPITVTGGATNSYTWNFTNNTPPGMSDIMQMFQNDTIFPPHIPGLDLIPGKEDFRNLSSNLTLGFMDGWLDLVDAVLDPVDEGGTFILGTIVSPLTLLNGLLLIAIDYLHSAMTTLMVYVGPIAWLLSRAFSVLPMKFQAVFGVLISFDIIKQLIRGDTS